MPITVTDVVGQGYCLGCGLCASVAGPDRLRMRLREDGFLAPEPLDATAGTVAGLRSFCPGVTVSLKQPLRNSRERLYGPFKDLKVAYAKDPVIRHRGASGGSLTALLCGLLEQGKVDGVLQTGACPERPARSCAHFSTSVEQVVSHAGSRYAPASLLENLKQLFEKYSQIAIVGKPCDIVAVRQFVESFPQYRSKVYCTLSFMCMGLPSHNATLKLIQRLGINDEKDVSRLIYRGSGWPGRARVLSLSGREHSCSYPESWGDTLSRELLFRCKICPDGWGSFADISAGDAWHTDGQGPLFDDKPGRSILFIRTDRGREVMEACASRVACEPYDIGELPIIQKAQHERKNRLWIAYLMLKLMGDRLLCFRGLGLWSRMFTKSPLAIAREARGILGRIQSHSRHSPRN
jgi:coenzyme F420 hydrogenase subunit beta